MLQYAWLIPALKIFIFIFVPLGGASAQSALYLFLVAWSLGGPRRSIEALTLTWLLNALNPGIYSFSPYSGVLRWTIVVTSFISIFIAFFRYRELISGLIYWFWGFCFSAAVLAFFTSYAVDISIFKITIFFLGGTAILMGFKITKNEFKYWQTWFLTFLVIVCLVSLPLIFSPLGYFRNGRGFQGILNHPQTYAVFAAPLVAWLFLLIIENKKWIMRFWFFMPVLVISIISLAASQGRTGVLAAAGALAIVFVRNTYKIQIRSLVKYALRGFVLMLLLFVIFWFNGDNIEIFAKDFLFKGSGADDISEAFYKSRGAGVESLFSNFMSHPWGGIGFGVPSDPKKMDVIRDPIFNLPISSPTEKGFAFVAILEEVGILGTTVFLGFIIKLISILLAKNSVSAPVALGIAAILTNFGEAIFFSLGGNGLLVWLLFGAAVAMKNEARNIT